MNKAINTVIDGISGLLILIMVYQHYTGETSAEMERGPFMLIIAMLVIALCGWLAKAITGPITRAIDNVTEKEGKQ